jgi:hypothetical protein
MEPLPPVPGCGAPMALADMFALDAAVPNHTRVRGERKRQRTVITKLR